MNEPDAQPALTPDELRVLGGFLIELAESLNSGRFDHQVIAGPNGSQLQVMWWPDPDRTAAVQIDIRVADAVELYDHDGDVDSIADAARANARMRGLYQDEQD